MNDSHEAEMTDELQFNSTTRHTNHDSRWKWFLTSNQPFRNFYILSQSEIVGENTVVCFCSLEHNAISCLEEITTVQMTVVSNKVNDYRYLETLHL